MPSRVAFALYQPDGSPKLDAVPIFTDYRGKNGTPRAQPAIVNLGGGLYAFVPTDDDVEAGVAYVIDSGPTSSPQFASGQIHVEHDPFRAFLFTDGQGGLWAGDAPTIGAYKDFAGANRTAPALLAPTSYLFVLVPTAADVAAGVAFRVDAPGTAEGFYSGSLGIFSKAGDFVVELAPDSEIVLYVGDRAPQMKFTLRDGNGEPVDLTVGAPEVSFSMRPASGGALVIDGDDVEILDAAAGQVLYDWPLDATENAGEYFGQFVLTRGGLEATFPYAKTLVIRVLDRL